MQGIDFSSRNPATSNVLNLAARNNDVRNVERLLKKLNPNCVDNRGWTCLHEAAYYDSYESLLLILKSPHVRGLAETHEGHTALYLACKNNCSMKTVRALLDSVEDIANYGSTEGVTPLHIASCQGNQELIELLLQYGAMINVQDFDGDTPLHEAAIAGQHGALLTLLYAGADAEIRNTPRGFSAFHLACCKGYFPNVVKLLPFVSDINHTTTTGDTPLHFALHGLNNDYNIIYYLLENGADPHIVNSCGEMAIDLALSTNEAVFRKLLEVTDKDKINKNLVINACKPHKFQFQILETILSSDLGPEFFNVVKPFDTDINQDRLTNCNYETHAPLNNYLYICWYIYKKSPEKFREFFYLFLMQGVSVNALEPTECPPLVYVHYVQYFHNTQDLINNNCFDEVFNILMEHGCDVDFCSYGRRQWKDVSISDAFITALDRYPRSSLLMMPYSIYNEPDQYLKYAISHHLIGVMPLHVQTQLMVMIDKDFRDIPSPENLDHFVPSLMHLCRAAIRNVIRHMTINGTLIEFSSNTFLRLIDTLPVPPVIKKYLRYIDI